MKQVLSILISTVSAVLVTRYWPQISETTRPALQAVQDTVFHVGPHSAWYASRATGITSYLLIWLSLVGGLLMSSAWFDGLIGRGRLLAFHQTAAILGVLLGLSHALVLIPDGWTKFSYYDLFVPFGSYYKPLLSGIGTLSLYL